MIDYPRLGRYILWCLYINGARWLLRVAPQGGSSGWLLRVAPQGGSSGWLLRVAPQGGSSGWLLKGGSSGWLLRVAPQGGSSGWLLRVAPQGGSSGWLTLAVIEVLPNPNMIACSRPGERGGGPGRSSDGEGLRPPE